MVLSMRSASYVRDGVTYARATDVSLGPAEHLALHCESALAAQTLAMMASAIARPTSGTVLIGEYDPRVQPVHCKKIATYVPHDPLPLHRRELDRYIAYRASLWNIDEQQAHVHATALLERMDGMHEAFAYPLIGALIGMPQLLVLDRPQTSFAEHIKAAAGGCAIFSTHTEAAAAAAFA